MDKRGEIEFVETRRDRINRDSNFNQCSPKRADKFFVDEKNLSFNHEYFPVDHDNNAL